MARIALMADIHGNLRALDAVLHDISRRGVRHVFDLGDVAYGSLQPGATIARLRERGVPSVRGNCDRLLLDVRARSGCEADVARAREEMSAEDLAWLADQPPTRCMDGLLLCHGTPGSDTTGLLETVRPRGVRLATELEILERLGGAGDASLVAVGHTHLPRAVRLSDGRMCVNPGSVGLPAYDDETPVAHCMESGSPHARYAIVERAARSWSVEHVSITYDWDAAADEALARGRADRAYWLRTGRGRFGGRPVVRS